MPPAALALTLAMGLASLGTLAWLFVRHIGGRPLLAYEPRRAVPWNFLAPAIVLLPTIVAIAAAGSQREPATASPAETLSATDLWGYAGATMVLTATYLVAMVAVFRATSADLGLPQNWSQLRRDVLIGVVAFLAALAPVYGLQFVLTAVFTPDQMHPLIEDLEKNFSPAMVLAALATAVVTAPWQEEVIFRLILQGWLERKLARTAVAAPGLLGVDPATPPTDGSVRDESPTLDDVMGEPMPAAAPPGRTDAVVLPSWPHGWAPVLASGGLFALAHLGHGVAPVSLFPLGVALGYVYQRTHRIVPSIVCHMLFNGLTMNVLWLTLSNRELAPGP